MDLGLLVLNAGRICGHFVLDLRQLVLNNNVILGRCLEQLGRLSWPVDPHEDWRRGCVSLVGGLLGELFGLQLHDLPLGFVQFIHQLGYLLVLVVYLPAALRLLGL